jgi:hypothetical protein
VQILKNVNAIFVHIFRFVNSYRATHLQQPDESLTDAGAIPPRYG